MLCENYMKLNTVEQSDFIGQLVTAAQTDNSLFEKAQSLINTARRIGVFKDIKVGTEAIEAMQENNNNNNQNY